MSNVKITQLPLASTPLTGAEVFPVVQSDITKQVSVTELFTNPVFVSPTLGTPAQGVLTNAVGLPISTGVAGLGTGVATFLATPTSANLRAAVSDETGTGALVFATSPTLVTPALGEPTALVATNATGTALGLIAGSVVTNANLTGAVTSVGNATSLGSFTSANLRSALTDETGSGSAVFATSPTLVTPDLGTPSSAILTNATGLPLTTGVTGTLAIANGGTGQTTANAAFNALAPSQTGNSGKYLTTDGSNTSWATNPLGTVTSVAMTVPSFLSVSGSPITSSGTLAVSLSGTALPTANGGTGLTSFTANGVVYASSTSALTTGSALTFDGTNTLKLKNTLTFDRYGDNTEGLTVSTNSGNGVYNTFGGLNHVWQLAGSEQMRLTSTGLGIGTSSPGAKLNTAAAYGVEQIRVQRSSATAEYGSIRYGSNGYDFCFDSVDVDNSLPAFAWRTSTDGSNFTQRMYLDSSGNLGLGVTPSAWSLLKAFQIGNTSLAGYSGTGYLMTNAYFDGSVYKYTSSNYANLYTQNNSVGQHAWHVAASGTAGNAISFTQAMTLDASGVLGVGVTSPTVTGGVSGIHVNSSGASGARIHMTDGTTGTTSGDGTELVVAAGDFYIDQKEAKSIIFYTNTAERMRLDSSGNLGVAMANPADYLGKFGVNGNIAQAGGGLHYFWDSANSFGWTIGNPGNALAFGNYGGSERMRLDASGNLLVGQTSNPAVGRIAATFAGNTTNGLELKDSTDTTGAAYIAFRDSGGSSVGSVTRGAGNTVAYNTSSDYRLKHDIAPMTGALDKVAALKPVTYKWNADGSDGEGFIAHELAEVCPQAVSGEKDAMDENGNPKYQGIDTSFLVATLTAAIQEQQAIITALTARVAALESV